MSTETRPTTTEDDIDDLVPPMLARSLEAFRRDLPRLLMTHYGQLVAYYGDEQMGFGNSETELYEKGFARGLKQDEFLVCSIEPEIPDEDITWSSSY